MGTLKCSVMKQRFFEFLHLLHCTFFFKPGCPETFGLEEEGTVQEMLSQLPFLMRV